MWGHIFDLQNPLVGADNTWVLWAICATGAAAAIYLEQRYKWAAKMTGAIVALIFAIILELFQWTLLYGMPYGVTLYHFPFLCYYCSAI